MHKIKRMFYWLFVDFDHGHFLIAPIQMSVLWLYHPWWILPMHVMFAVVFTVYQCWEYIEKRNEDQNTADRAHHALKGYLIGLMLSMAVVAISERIMECF